MLPLTSSFQARYCFVFIALTTFFLLLLNFYAATTLRTISFRNKHDAILPQNRMVAASLNELEELNADSVGQVMGLLNDLNFSRILVTNASCAVVYDSVDNTLLGKTAIYPEIVKALEGNDVFYCRIIDSAVVSHAAIPVMAYGTLKGCVYIMDQDATQRELIDSLEKNILYTSLALELAVLVLATTSTIYYSSRTRRVIRSMQTVHEGDYGTKIAMRGSDEIGTLAREFDALTERLQTAEEGRRQFVSDASHELKTPLAAIKLLTDSILQNDMDKEMILEFVSDIGAEADRLTRMSQKLLNLSKIDSALQIDRTVTDVREMVRASIAILTPLADMSFIEIVEDLEPDCTVLAFEDDIHQIVFNLIDNAIKYNREDGKIWVHLHREEDDVTLIVEDCGIGIPKEEMGHIFERFYRVDKARSRERGGAGLGLSLVHDMVVRNDGEVTVGARDGGGTTFTVKFPFFAMPTEIPEAEDTGEESL